MVDKITTVRRQRLGRSIGALGEDDLMRLNRAIVVFLGLAGGSSPRRGTRRGGKRKAGAGRSR
jgi:mRNA interferase MazF